MVVPVVVVAVVVVVVVVVVVYNVVYKEESYAITISYTLSKMSSQNIFTLYITHLMTILDR